MKNLSAIVIKWSSVIASMALTIGLSSATAACYWWFNQPNMPKELENFKK